LLRLLVYAWNITPEGKGRVIRAPDGTEVPRPNFRIQTTRSHEGDLLSPPGCLAAGLGWDEARGVFGAFDPWIKRTTGVSSSVHITKQLLDTAAQDGWGEEQREDGPECAFQPEQVQRYLEWLMHLQQPRYAQLLPSDFVKSEKTCRVTVHPRAGDDAFVLRDGDHFVVAGPSGPKDSGVWRVLNVETTRTRTEAERQRIELVLTGRLIGVTTARGVAES